MLPTWVLRLTVEGVVPLRTTLCLADAGLKRAVAGFPNSASGLSATLVTGVGVVVVDGAGLPKVLEGVGLFSPVARAKGVRV